MPDRMREYVDPATRRAHATVKVKQGGKVRYKYPIHDKAHARAALRLINRAKPPLTPAQKKRVRAKAKAMLAEEEIVSTELTEVRTGSSMGGHSPKAHGKIRYIVREFGSWANGKQSVAARKLLAKGVAKTPERANALAAWLKDQWAGTTKWRGTGKKQKAESKRIEAKARATVKGRFAEGDWDMEVDEGAIDALYDLARSDGQDVSEVVADALAEASDEWGPSQQLRWLEGDIEVMSESQLLEALGQLEAATGTLVECVSGKSYGKKRRKRRKRKDVREGAEMDELAEALRRRWHPELHPRDLMGRFTFKDASGRTFSMSGNFNLDGIFINGRRPKSKKEVKEAIKADPSSVVIERTSMFDNKGNISADLLGDETITFVGPDPYTKRNFYGNIKRKGDKLVVSSNAGGIWTDTDEREWEKLLDQRSELKAQLTGIPHDSPVHERVADELRDLDSAGMRMKIRRERARGHRLGEAKKGKYRPATPEEAASGKYDSWRLKHMQGAPNSDLSPAEMKKATKRKGGVKKQAKPKPPDRDSGGMSAEEEDELLQVHSREIVNLIKKGMSTEDAYDQLERDEDSKYAASRRKKSKAR